MLLSIRHVTVILGPVQLPRFTNRWCDAEVRNMVRSITVGYGDRAGYDATAPSVLAAAHEHHEHHEHDAHDVGGCTRGRFTGFGGSGCGRGLAGRVRIRPSPGLICHTGRGRRTVAFGSEWG